MLKVLVNLQQLHFISKDKIETIYQTKLDAVLEKEKLKLNADATGKCKKMLLNFLV